MEEKKRHTRALVLAAGKGVRMKAGKSKVLLEILGKTIIEYAVDALEIEEIEQIGVVVGEHNVDEIRNVLGARVIYVMQKEQLGTGHAVMAAKDWLTDFSGDVVVAVGDGPFITPVLIRDLIRTRQSQNYAASFLSALYEQPPPYGRVVREKSGRVLRIVEEEDATEVEKNIKEVNSSHYCFDTPKLMEAIMKIRSDNAQKEYYLPDVIEILVKDDHGVEALQVDNPLLIAGINTRKDLADGVETLKKRIIEKWLENHVTIIDPATTYIDATVRIGKDTIIYPFTFLSGHSDIGNDCRIGPFVRMVSSNIEDGVSINWVNMEKNKIIRESSSKKFRR